MPKAAQLLLSNILKKYTVITGPKSRSIQVKWIDFGLGSLDDDYPRVENIHFRENLLNLSVNSALKLIPNGVSQSSALPWSAVKDIDWSSRQILISDLDSIQLIDEDRLAQAVLLARDILDAYVIDLQNRRLRRANDLLLEYSQGLYIKAADTGMRALLRRLSGGIYHGFHENDLQDWKYVEFLRGDPGAVRAGARYHRRIERLPPGEIANLAEGLPYLHATEEIMLLPLQQAADTMELLSSERQLQIFEELEENFAAGVLEKMAPDIAADLIGRLPIHQARNYLELTAKRTSERIIDLLRYPENSVGGIMTNDMIALPGNLSVAEARKRLRNELQEPDFVYFIYVVENDENRRLSGVITLRTILIARDDQLLEDIMNPYLETLGPLDSPREAAFRLIKSQLAALPVIASDRRLLGVVTVDAAVSLVAPGAWSSQAPRIFS